MKFALHDYNFTALRSGDDKYVGEVILPYLSQFDALNKLTREVELGHRVVFDLNTGVLEQMKPEDLAKDLEELVTVHGENVAFLMPIAGDALSKKCPNIIFSADCAAKTYQEAMSMYNVDIREIYVTGSLAASMDDLKRLHKIMKLRMIPNHVQTDAFRFGNPGAVDPLQCFWVRPEAIEMYNGVIDTIEFASDEWHTEAGLLAIYVRGFWYGKIGSVVMDPTGLLDGIHNKYADAIDIVRSQCGLKCQVDNSCHLCTHIQLESDLSTAGETEKSEGTKND